MSSEFTVEPTPPEPHSHEIAAALERSVRLSDVIFANHPDECDFNGRDDYATRFFGLALDHREAVIPAIGSPRNEPGQEEIVPLIAASRHAVRNGFSPDAGQRAIRRSHALALCSSYVNKDRARHPAH